MEELEGFGGRVQIGRSVNGQGIVLKLNIDQDKHQGVRKDIMSLNSCDIKFPALKHKPASLSCQVFC